MPEIFAGSVEIKAIAREASERSKVAVRSKEDGIDPVGACIGQRGTRIQTIIAELSGEKIDIIQWDDDPAKYIANSLSPARVVAVDVYEKDKRAVAHVEEYQLSLAIGKRGQNVRLAAKLTGWRIDVVKAGEEDSVEAKAAPDQEVEVKGEEEETEEEEKIEKEEKDEKKEDKEASETKEKKTEGKKAKKDKGEEKTKNKDKENKEATA